MLSEKINIIAIVGSTASGKTRLSLDIARKFNGEIVSADSMQIYREFEISTAKPTKIELSEVKHYLIDTISVKDEFSVADYVKIAKKSISEIDSNGKMPILVGGTGLYIDSLINNVEFNEEKVDKTLREQLWQEVKDNGPESLINELKIVDKESAENIHPNNYKKLIRAVEFYRTTGTPISKQVEDSKKTESLYNAKIVGLGFRDRSILYNRINKRVDEMVENGLIEEAKQIYKMNPSKTARGAIGYKELVLYLRGLFTLKEDINKIKMETRRYAKRQITWFKRNKSIKWFYVDDYNDYDSLLIDVAEYLEKDRY